LTLIIPNIKPAAGELKREEPQIQKKPNVINAVAKGASGAATATASAIGTAGAAVAGAAEASVGSAMVGVLGGIGAVIPFVFYLILLVLPLGMLGLGFYLPYDMVFGNDSLGFAEYSELFLAVYGISAVLILVSVIAQIRTGEPRMAFIYIYAYSVLLLMVGCFREGHPIAAIVSIFPALILFVFPSLVHFIIVWILDRIIGVLKKKGKGPKASEKVNKTWTVIFHVVGVILLVAAGIMGYLLAEV